MKKINIPEGYQTVMPYLILSDALKFMEFAQKIFGATIKMKKLNDDQTLMHGEIQVGGSTIMIGGSSEQWSPQPAGLYVHVMDADDTYKKALMAGAVSVMEPADRDYGRSGGVKDPFGNTWWITTVS